MRQVRAWASTILGRQWDGGSRSHGGGRVATDVWLQHGSGYLSEVGAHASITEVTPVGRQSDVDVTNAMVGRYDYACSGRERVRPCELNAEGTVERTACWPTGQGHKGGANLWV